MINYQLGELDQAIDIYRWTQTPDGQGGFTKSGVLQHGLMAHVRHKGGGEQFKFEKVEAIAITTFVIHNLGLDIREDDYILWDSVQYNIRSMVKTGDRDIFLEIDAERGVAQ